MMDSSRIAIEDLCCCQICFNDFGTDEYCPRILSCGHSFCQACLKKLLGNRSLCPTCKKEFSFESVEDISINYIAKNFSQLLKEDEISQGIIKNRYSEKNQLPYEGHCEEHKLPNHFMCNDCSSFICGTCSQLYHKECGNILLVSEAMKVLNDDNLKKITTMKSQLTSEIEILNREELSLQKNISALRKKSEKTVTKQKLSEAALQRLSSLQTTLKQSNCSQLSQELKNARSEVNSLFDKHNLSFNPSEIPRDDDAKSSSKVKEAAPSPNKGNYDSLVSSFFIKNSDVQVAKTAPAPRPKHSDVQVAKAAPRPQLAPAFRPQSAPAPVPYKLPFLI